MADVMLVLGGLALGTLLGYLLAVVRRVTTGDARRRSLEGEVVRLRSELDAERRVGAERVAALQADQRRLTEQFRSVASEALAANNEQFLGLAEQRLRATQQAHDAALAGREQAVRALVDPLSRALDQVRAEVTTAEKLRAAGQVALSEQVRAMRESSEHLRGETSRLVTALRASQVRGRWGELQLRRVVEAAGMLDRVDFTEQGTVRTDDGDLRPDMVVHLAGGKNVVVDAKVAFLGFLEAQEATDERTRAERLAAHARHVRTHVDQLAAKQYWQQFSPAPEFVVMFVPAEAFLTTALEQDPAIFEHAFAKNVVLATPSTLLALLRTVAYAWRQDSLAQNAQQVLDLGKELHGRLATMGGHIDRLGRQIQGTAEAYNRTVASLETRVLVSARRFAELDVVDGDLPAPGSVQPHLSVLRAPELLASAEDQVVPLVSGERG